MIKVVFAMGPSREFGNGDNLPWPHIKCDMQKFKEVTADSIVVMGANTWKSLPNKLPGRLNVVLSEHQVENKSGEHPDMRFKHHDLRQVVTELEVANPGKDVCIIGGLKLIDEAIDFAERICLSRILVADAFACTHNVPEDTLVKITNNYVKSREPEYKRNPAPGIQVWAYVEFERKL